MREFKIGDWVIYINKEVSAKFKKAIGVSLYGKVAKIIYRGTIALDYGPGFYLLEFKDPIGNAYVYEKLGKKDHCGWCSKNEFKSINYLKFKKWIKG